MMLSSSKIQLQLLVPVNLPEKDIITTKFPLQNKGNFVTQIQTECIFAGLQV